jgi:hypothetical protein
MTDTTAVETNVDAPATKVPKGKTAGAKAGAKPSTKTAAKGATTKAAKAPKAPKAEKPAKETAATRFAGKKITVVNKDHTARPGTKRAIAMDILVAKATKTTDAALEQFAQYDGIDSSFIRHAVEAGYITIA